MKKSISEICEEHKAEVAYRTDRTQATFGEPQLSSSPVVFEVSEKTSGIAHGGVALIHQVVVQCGLVDAINEVPVLLLHMPYHESDHLLNITYNFLCGGTALEHIEYRRQDPTYLDMFVLCPHSNEASSPIIRQRSQRDRHSPKKLSKHWKNTVFPIRRRRAIFAVGIHRSRLMPCRTRSTASEATFGCGNRNRFSRRRSLTWTAPSCRLTASASKAWT